MNETQAKVVAAIRQGVAALPDATPVHIHAGDVRTLLAVIDAAGTKPEPTPLPLNAQPTEA